MIYIYRLALVSLLIIGCKSRNIDAANTVNKHSYNNSLAQELSEMTRIDQKAVLEFQNKTSNLSPEQIQSLQDSIFALNYKRTKDIFNKYGFIGYDLAGTEGSTAFWLLVQHSDLDPKFQSQVLRKMKIEIGKGNANSSEYGLLVDRVNVNLGKKQVYGTQVLYDQDNCQAYPKKISDSINVDKRRESIGLPPLKSYLNQMSRMHFEMNRDSYLQEGIKGPKFYKQ